ncbi:MAG TPA: DUF1800 domain-containing protein [Tepidisphaeraceae bacterium]|nr:DUF1800 domain-containing protein [Tepidisphaeraceae bacterium]
MTSSYSYYSRYPRVGAAATAMALLILLAVIPTPARAQAPAWSRDDAAHLIRRAGFGATPGQIDRLYALGRDGAVDYLIAGKLPEGASAPFAHAELPAFAFDPDLQAKKQGPVTQFELQKLRAWWIDRMVRTDRPLEEKMSLFWHGLFTSGFREVKNVRWLAKQNELFHKEAIGNYKRLTHEIIHDPAMLRYLNNDQNIKGRPNENLARELMELFTMGEGNGYAEKDIGQVARALTGMTVNPRQEAAMFFPKRHDDGMKTIFGKTGNYGPDDVVNLIFDRPYPAHHLAERLWVYFGTPEPAQADVNAVADALRTHNWEVAPALRVLFTSPAFYSDQTRDVMIKSPVDLEVSTLRLLEEPPQPRLLAVSAGGLQQLGEALFQPPNVKGWVGGEHWITSGTIFARYRICEAMAGGAFGANFGNNPGGKFGGKAGKLRNAAKLQKLGNDANSAPQSATVDTKNPATTAAAEIGANQPKANTTPAPKAPATIADARRDRVVAERMAQRQRVLAELAKIPPLPPAEQMVAPAKLFAALGAHPTAVQLVDAAVTRFIQQPLPTEKKTALVNALGNKPLVLGELPTDQRVRQMIGLLLSTPEYQME